LTLTVITGMKVWRVMNDGAAAWSGLGSTMNLPSAMKEEMDTLRMELRDLKLDVTKDLMALRDTVDSVIGDLVSIIERQRSMLTRIEGLEVRAQSGSAISAPTDPFNAFAYVGLEELEGSSEEIESVEVSAESAVDSDGSVPSDEPETNKGNAGPRVLSDEDWAAEFLEVVESHIDEVGGILNNVLFSKLWRNEIAPTPEIKKLVKAALKADETIELYKLSKLRGLYHRTGGDALGIYKRIYG
jgi:hypothetical protein